MRTPSLTTREREIAKRLLADGLAYQDVQQLINTGRSPTINPGRLARSADWNVTAATDEEVSRYRYEKSLVDLKSGLSPIDDERLFRAREAMMSAVQIFNSPSLMFKIETYPVLSQIAWTYLLHEYYVRKSIPIVDESGSTVALSQMINRDDCPLVLDVKKNLIALKVLRDQVEHRLLSSVGKWYWPLFQANCFNFDQTIRKLFGERAGLESTMSLALQFGKMELDQLSHLQKYDLSPAIEAIDAQIAAAIKETGAEGANYKFKVHYSFEKAAKGESHIVFTENNKYSSNISTILTKKVVGDELWPYKPSVVVQKVSSGSGEHFSSHDHQLAWKKFGARPRSGSNNPDNCRKEFCYYHAAHKDYTYSDKWIELLIAIASNPTELAELRAYEPNKK